jgi:hypothetical protein
MSLFEIYLAEESNKNIQASPRRLFKQVDILFDVLIKGWQRKKCSWFSARRAEEVSTSRCILNRGSRWHSFRGFGRKMRLNVF